ncbi:MAG: DNA polymerase IV [Bradymonadales bacterium]
MQRLILHCDINNCFASIEAVLNPSLRGKAIAVCGSQAERHGIVLAKSEAAKRYGVKTGEVIWQAKRKCPNLLIVAPHYDAYLHYSKEVRKIYESYTNQVESFGLDECWLDLSQSLALLNQRSGSEIAYEIKERVKRELGFTLSIGVSFNKVFAKLASDLKKPDAVTLIRKEEFKSIVWPLDVSLLLGVGRSTCEKLKFYAIHSIGDLARSPAQLLKRILGKNGSTLWINANGLDSSPVLYNHTPIPHKSMGHGQTFAADLVSLDEVRCALLFLAQHLSQRLRDNETRASGVQLTIRDSALVFKQFQERLAQPSQSAALIAKTAFKLFSTYYLWQKNVRALTITVYELSSTALPLQGSLFADRESIAKNEALEKSIYDIRQRFGKRSILPASILSSKKLSSPLPQGIGPPTHSWKS